MRSEKFEGKILVVRQGSSTITLIVSLNVTYGKLCNFAISVIV